jgi:molecular chaperone GrpE
MCPKIPITPEGDENKDKNKDQTVERAEVEVCDDEAFAAGAAGQTDGGERDTAPAADPCTAHQAARAYGVSSSQPHQGAGELPDLEIKPGRAEQQLPQGNVADEYLDMLRRMKAEFENYKKRTRREKADTIRFANEDVFRKMLPILDNLQRGIAIAHEQGMSQDMFKGIEMVGKQIQDLLADYGVVPFESLNKPFDPNYHEPMSMVDRDDVEDNTVVQELEHGYMMHDRVLRVARVIVSRKPAGESQADDTGSAGGGE